MIISLVIISCVSLAATTGTGSFPGEEKNEEACSLGILVLPSCKDIKSACPNTVTDYYQLRDREDEEIHKVYCNMDELCGDSQGGWMRVAYLNMSDPSENCPMGTLLNEKNGVRGCGRYQSGGCASLVFSSKAVHYSQVCGRVYGYQKGTTDGIGQHKNKNLNDNYVDGISITRGNPRKHIWTFISGHYETTPFAGRSSTCPCSNGQKLPEYVSNDYFCESGNSDDYRSRTKLYTEDMLWDGKQCGAIEQECCSVPGLPWFHRTFETPTTEDIEIRICGNQNIYDEDTPIAFYEIYVK